MSSEPAAIDNLIQDVSEIPQLTKVAQLCEHMERWPDMCRVMKKVVETRLGKTETIPAEERNLLSVAYKNVVGAQRSSFRAVQSIKAPDLSYSGTLVEADVDGLIAGYKKSVADEVQNSCKEVIALLKKVLSATEPKKEAEDEIFFKKMQADYYRYLSEIMEKGQELVDGENPLEKMTELYKSAMDTAQMGLPETHPTRLGLALNFSVAYYEILKKPAEACELAKRAFDNAIKKLDTLNDASYKDSTLIMQLLRDNLTLWTSENPENAAGGQEETADGANP